MIVRGEPSGRWFENIAGEWLIEDGDVFDRFAEDYVNDPLMSAEELEQRIDRYLEQRSTPEWRDALLRLSAQRSRPLALAR